MKTCVLFLYVGREKGFRKVIIGFAISKTPLSNLYDVKFARMVRTDNEIDLREITPYLTTQELDMAIDKADKKDYREYLNSLKQKKADTSA